MYNLIENSDNYSETSGSLWQFFIDEPALTDGSIIDNFPCNSVLLNLSKK